MDYIAIELLGYLAMIVVFISFFMSDIRKLRIVNIVACTLFTIYGLITLSYPIIITNLGIILIHIYGILNKKTS